MGNCMTVLKIFAPFLKYTVKFKIFSFIYTWKYFFLLVLVLAFIFELNVKKNLICFSCHKELIKIFICSSLKHMQHLLVFLNDMMILSLLQDTWILVSEISEMTFKCS